MIHCETGGGCRRYIAFGIADKEFRIDIYLVRCELARSHARASRNGAKSSIDITCSVGFLSSHSWYRHRLSSVMPSENHEMRYDVPNSLFALRNVKGSWWVNIQLVSLGTSPAMKADWYQQNKQISGGLSILVWGFPLASQDQTRHENAKSMNCAMLGIRVLMPLFKYNSNIDIG